MSGISGIRTSKKHLTGCRWKAGQQAKAAEISEFNIEWNKEEESGNEGAGSFRISAFDILYHRKLAAGATTLRRESVQSTILFIEWNNVHFYS